MNKFFLIAASLFICIAAWGVKVHPGSAVITQSDGSKITVYAYGDADNYWYTTSDGVLLYHEGFDFFIAKVDSEGNLAPTKQLAHEPSNRTASEKNLVREQNRKLFYEKANEASMHKAQRREPVADDNTLFFHTGSPKALVILAEFTDSVFKDADPKSVFEEYLNADVINNNVGNGTVGRNHGSVKKYFSDMSFGTFTPQFDIYGPVQLSHNLKYYGAGKDHMDRLIPEVCQLADEEIDFSQYDENNDGYVDLVYIICAGYSQSWVRNSSDCIWPKSGSAANYSRENFGTFDGKQVFRFGVHTELNAYPGAFSQPYRINGIGLFCHEFSHCMGLPDIYPTTETAQNALNPAMEYWDLMDAGEYTYNGYYPTEYTAWEREALGWFTIDTLTTDDKGSISVGNINDGGKAYRIINEKSANGKEYVILQYIQNTGWNAKLPGSIRVNGKNVQLPGHGMLVTHVDYDANAFSLQHNSVNNTIGHSRYTVIPADGEYISSYDKSATDSILLTSMAADPFPGTLNVTELLSIPFYTGDDTSKPITNIVESNAGVTFDYIVPNDTIDTPEGVAVDNLFINSTTDAITLNNAEFTSYNNGNDVIEATEFTDAEIILANGLDISDRDSLHLDVYSYDEIDLKVELVFDESNGSNGIKRNEEEADDVYGTTTLVARQWNNIDLAIEKLAPEGADLTRLKKIVLYGGTGKPLFINNVYFYSELPNSIVDVITNHPSPNNQYYTIEGMMIDSKKENLKKGIYIINGKKYVVK